MEYQRVRKRRELRHLALAHVPRVDAVVAVVFP
jgi:hypothetical protein